MLPVNSKRFRWCCGGVPFLCLALLTAISGCDASTSASNGSPAAGGNGTDEESDPIVAQKAVAGVGKQGQSLQGKQGAAGIIAGPLSALANVKQKVALEFQVKQALDLYKATNGRFPNSHEEFMQQIVDANRIQLPELPEGAVYHFNSEKGELWVYPEDEVPSD